MNRPATIRIRIDVPGSEGSPDVPLAEAMLERFGPGAEVEAWQWQLTLAPRPGAERKRAVWKHGLLTAFPRKRSGCRVNAFDLLYRVLRDAVHYRNRGGEPKR